MHEHNLEHSVWNKGLTKETDERVLKESLKTKEIFDNKVKNGWKPVCAQEEFWTDERRLERSLKKKNFYKEHPEKHPNRLLAGNKKNINYPENITLNWLEKHQIHYIYQYQTIFKESSRYVDFFLPEYNLYIEVDGEYWHKDKELDIEKDRFAETVQNIKTLRIVPKRGIEKQLEEYFLKK